MTNQNYNSYFRALALIAFLFGAWFTNPVFAQTSEAQAAKIRQLYTETNRRIEAGLKDKTSGLHYAAWTIGGTSDGQQWRAIGTMKTTDEFWFDGEPGFDEGQVANARKTVRRIVSTVVSASLNSRTEYLFDDASELVFVYLKENAEGDEGIHFEQRFYFARGKLIRLAEAGRNLDGKYTAEQTAAATEQQRAAKRLQNIFAVHFAE